MKKFLLAAGVAGGAVVVLRRLPRNAAALKEHCSRCFSRCHRQPEGQR